MFPAESQEGDHEVVEVPVQHRLDVPRLIAAAQILHELVRSEDIRADLAPPGDVAQRPGKGLQLLYRRSARWRSASLAARICRAFALFWCWLRSFWHEVTIPVGRCVIRTAESVTFTCWPPAPEER